MREIKFRAWIKKAKEMVPVTEILFDFNRKNIFRCTPRFGFDNTEDSYAVLMQFTGLFDKNGKEIYEGDVVSAWSTGVKTIGEVKQRNDGMWFIYPPLWHFNPNSKGRDDVEIIGNIYENPELLKEATL